jgi:hypothetical protein
MTTNRMGLEQTLSDGELTVITDTDHVQCGDAAAMARELLAYRKASKDVAGYLYEGDGAEWPSISLPEELDEQQIANCIPLFAAPPLQAVTVPDEICIRQAMVKMEDHDFCTSVNSGYKNGWNDCVAAMLKSVTNEP